MDAVPSPHPTDRTLSSYGLGKLDGSVAEAVNEHLSGCPDCRRRVGELSSDSFLGRLRDAREAPGRAIAGGSLMDGTISFMKANAPAAPPPADTLPPGLAEHPDYEVKRELGRGGMGVVYLAHNRLMDRDEVLKVLGRHLVERPGVLNRFLREIRAVARLRHPNIVTAYSAFRLRESIVFAMEYVEGLDLSKLVKLKGPLPVAHACSFAHQSALGLQHAHENGMVHRDVKPGNLMLSRKGDKAVVKVLDFGLAKATREGPVDGGLTHAGQMLGTPDFIAPEQTIDAQRADIRADIYSLGCTLYYLLTGGPPFRGKSLYDILQAHHSMDAAPLNLARPEVPVELAALVAKMMAKEPHRRFQAPAEVAEALAPLFKKGRAAFQGAKADVSQAGQTTASLPASGTVFTPTQPATDAGGPTIRPIQVAKPPEPEPRWKGLVKLQEPESAIAPPRVGASDRRPPRKSWPMIAAASLFGFIALGIIITIKTRNGEVKIDASDDKPFQAGVNGIHIEYKQSESDREDSTTAQAPAGKPPVPRGAKSFVAAVGEGNWAIEGDALVQSRLEPGLGEVPWCYLTFGDPNWSDYDITLEANKVGGPDAFGVLFHWQSINNNLAFNLGGYGNQGCELRSQFEGRWGREDSNYRWKNVSFNEWHRIKVEVRSERARCYFNDELLFEDSDSRFTKGRIGLSTWKTAAKFRRIKVTSPDGTVLFEGLPEMPRALGGLPAGTNESPARALAGRPNTVRDSG